MANLNNFILFYLVKGRVWSKSALSVNSL